MDLDTQRDAIASAGAALTAACRADGRAPVPWCGAWTVADVTRHLGAVHRWAGAMVRDGLTERPRFEDGPAADDPALPDWADAGRSALLDAMATADLDRPVWAFGSQEPARFWCRRQTHETAVHAWDGTAAVGEPWEIPGDVASDGVEEFLGWFIPRKWSRQEPAWGSGRTIHLHRTDGDGEWLLTIGREPTLDHGHAKGDLAVRGSASDLLRWTLNRPATVELFGDEALAQAWREQVTF